MNKELELWHFILERLQRNENVMLLVVAESSGSSPGRQGYKMAVAADGELIGSIGGGLMEVNLVERAKAILSVPPAVAGGFREQVHRKNVANASGMICSGKQTVIFYRLSGEHSSAVSSVVKRLQNNNDATLQITQDVFSVTGEENPPVTAGGTDKIDPPAYLRFNKLSDTEFVYSERLGAKNNLYIIGGGHCALALSELMSKMDFHISLFDDRPEINTVEKNRFADEITIIDSYDEIDRYIRPGENSYVVVMTLGYKSDDVVIRRLINHDLKYFGVLGSNAKMTTMLRELVKEGLPGEMLDRIHTPIGLSINSRTPEEIAVSIAAEIISVKNAE